MSDSKPPVGSIGWHDLTVPDAARIRDFYGHVVGWRPEPVDMGGYSDYAMRPPGNGPPAGGICHARGVNSDLPPQWLIYIIVDDVRKAAERCVELGGELVREPAATGGAMVCVIRDPAGAVCALHQP